MNARTDTAAGAVISHAREAADVANVAVSFVSDNLFPVLTAVVELANFDSMDMAALKRRLCTIFELAKAGCYLAEDAASQLESREMVLKATLDDLKRGNA